MHTLQFFMFYVHVYAVVYIHTIQQETRMLSQALNRAMPHSRNQLEEGVDRKEIIFYLAVQL